MKKFFRIIITIIIVAIAIFYIRHYSSIKLVPPENPPFFSVIYTYYFNPLFTFSFEEIKNDIKNIKNAGFEGVKINFAFRQDNFISEEIAQIAAKNSLYPIGQLIGHREKPKERAFTNEELSKWEEFVRSEVRKNKDIIYFWEIWNEPCMVDMQFRYGTPAEYLELLKRTQKIIKEENPSAKIIVTADTGVREASAFTNEFLALGGGKYFDFLSFHPYTTDKDLGLEEMIFNKKMAEEQQLLVKYHINKPLWISEIGYPNSEFGEDGQAQRAETAFKTAYNNKIPIVWLHYSDRRLSTIDGKTGWGLVREDNTFKPAYEKIKAFISQAEAEN